MHLLLLGRITEVAGTSVVESLEIGVQLWGPGSPGGIQDDLRFRRLG